MLLRELITEAWSDKYKRSINCASPKGFSQKAHCQGRKKEEDQHPNDTPLGPETKPTMPAGTVRVDVDDVYDWYKLGQHISNMKGLGKHDFGKGPPSTIFSFGNEEEEHKYIDALKKTGLTTTDIDPIDPNQPRGMKKQKVDPTYNVAEVKKRKRKTKRPAYGPGPYGWYGFDSGYSGEGGAGDGGGMEENFADGRNPQDKGDSKRHNVPTKGKISTLRKIAKQGGRKGQLAHWMANMRSGRRKTNEGREEPSIIDALQLFLPIVMYVLDLDKLPKIKLHKEINDTDQPTFGRFLNDDLVIEIGLVNRHPNDILRTLAHELVHFKQLLDGEIGPHSGDTGSPQENEANAKAGIIMRLFNKKYPEFLSIKPYMLSETATAGATSAANIATVVSPHLAIGNVKSYGKGSMPKPPKAKQIKNKNGTAKNALDIKTSIFGGGPIKR